MGIGRVMILGVADSCVAFVFPVEGGIEEEVAKIPTYVSIEVDIALGRLIVVLIPVVAGRKRCFKRIGTIGYVGT